MACSLISVDTDDEHPRARGSTGRRKRNASDNSLILMIGWLLGVLGVDDGGTLVHGLLLAGVTER